MNPNRDTKRHKLPSLEAREMKFFGEQPSRVPKMEESRGDAEGQTEGDAEKRGGRKGKVNEES